MSHFENFIEKIYLIENLEYAVYCSSSNELLKKDLFFLGPGFDSTSLERINRNERNVTRKKKESAKEF